MASPMNVLVNRTRMLWRMSRCPVGRACPGRYGAPRPSANDAVRLPEGRVLDVEADELGGAQVDLQVVLGGLYREVGGLRPLEDLIGQPAGLLAHGEHAGPVG